MATIRPMRNQKLIVRALLISAVTIALLVLVWRKVAPSTQIAPIHLTPANVGLAALGCIAFLIARAWRTEILLAGRAQFLQLLGCTGVSWGAGLLLPGPSADATFIVVANRNLGVGTLRGTSISVLARVLDVISLAFVIVAASAFDTASQSTLLVLGALLLGLGLTGALALCSFRQGRRLIMVVAARVPLIRKRLVAVEEALDDLSSPMQLAMLFVSTLACRLSTLVQYAAFFSMVDLHISLWSVWFILAIRTFLSTIPIQGIANLGTGQVWWTSALILEGVSSATALGVSITISLADLAVSLPVSLGCWAVLHLTGRSRATPPAAIATPEAEAADVVEVARVS